MHVVWPSNKLILKMEDFTKASVSVQLVKTMLLLVLGFSGNSVVWGTSLQAELYDICTFIYWRLCVQLYVCVCVCVCVCWMLRSCLHFHLKSESWLSDGRICVVSFIFMKKIWTYVMIIVRLSVLPKGTVLIVGMKFVWYNTSNFAWLQYKMYLPGLGKFDHKAIAAETCIFQ